MKAKRKILSILVTLSMLMALLVPLAGVAGAATVNYSAITTVKSFDPTSSGAANLQLATVEVSINPYSDTITSTALLEVIDGNGKSLPIKKIVSNTNGTLKADDGTTIKTYLYTFKGEVVDTRTNAEQLTITIDGSDANSGEVQAKFSKCGGQLVAGTVTLANAKGGALEVSVPSVMAISDAGVSVDDGVVIRVNETVNGGFDESDNSIKFKLPNGFKWDGAQLAILNRTDLNVADYFAYDDDGDSGRTLAISAVGGYSGTVLLEITAGIEVDSTVAKYGDVKVKISGDSTVTPSEAVIATYGDYEAKVTSVTTETVISGQVEQDIGKFAIEEALAGTLVAGRTITLKLPEQAKWDTPPDLSTGDSDNIGNFALENGFQVAGTDNRTVKATIKTASTGDEPTKIVFKDGQISVRADYTGDIVLTVEGSAGVTGTVKVAEAKAPVTATAASKPEVIIGMGSQAAGDITITETEAEALQSSYDDIEEGTTSDAYLRIEAPTGVRFASEPTFTVTGDLQIGDPLCDTDSQYVEVRIKGTSSEPSSIKISDIKLIVDRTVPEGDIQLKVGGTSLVENNITDYFPNVNWVTKVAVAKVITPAPENTKVTTVFKIGDPTYTVNGVEKTMDVAPYIKDDRTYLPIRYAAYAAGVTDNNIIWNAADQSVVLIKGDRVIKLVVGSTTMLVNGVPFAMDVAPEIVDPGRVMLPLRWVAQALGCEVNWDAATQTVTIN